LLEPVETVELFANRHVFQRVPKFVKEYAHIGAGIEGAVKAFANEVRARAFPSADYTYPMCDEPEMQGHLGADNFLNQLYWRFHASRITPMLAGNSMFFSAAITFS